MADPTPADEPYGRATDTPSGLSNADPIVSITPTPIDSEPILPDTPYHDDGEGVPRASEGLLTVQLLVLRYLQDHPADTVTSSRANAWTEAIDSQHAPSVQEVLRLCYYMRQLGIATFCQMRPDKKEIALYIVNAVNLTRRSDHCYWVQNFSTGAVGLPRNRLNDRSIHRLLREMLARMRERIVGAQWLHTQEVHQEEVLRIAEDLLGEATNLAVDRGAGARGEGDADLQAAIQASLELAVRGQAQAVGGCGEASGTQNA
ncbi:uncharacterized protein BDR25DRAFT_42422 [Lindgomyces ingoldianus]|uniref:Uncharacterized protein n=1 Tax=Lindgomyces ingoldianus TaxID=673940 RepID=A0ACB6REN5_9PLEO|nr:uncharacterized protein BDR25DRAFT_42422 [Lindgomyces ingoldianus]KAF2476946.1 hypothetical protein BDR25DRAFT_42422 [Lindgomyces ingoldianus]